MLLWRSPAQPGVPVSANLSGEWPVLVTRCLKPSRRCGTVNLSKDFLGSRNQVNLSGEWPIQVSRCQGWRVRKTLNLRDVVEL